MSCSSYTSTAARRWTLSLLEWQAHTDYSSWIWLAQNSHAAEHILLWAQHAWYLLASNKKLLGRWTALLMCVAGVCLQALLQLLLR